MNTTPRRLLLASVLAAFAALGSSAPSQAGHAFTWHVPVLEYHYTTCPTTGDPGAYLHICESDFRAQLTYLVDHGWRAISGAKLAEHFAAGRAPAAKTFVISVDDDTTERFTSTYPVLKSMGLVGTFMIATARIGLPGQMTWDDVRAMQAGGMDIENHTADHPHLSSLTYAQQAAEIVRSQATFRKALGRVPTIFALPFGDYDATTLRMLGRSRLVLGFSSIEGAPKVSSAQPFLTHRIAGPLYPDPVDLMYRMTCLRACKPAARFPASLPGAGGSADLAE